MKKLKFHLATLALATILPLASAQAESRQGVNVKGNDNEVRLSGNSPCAAINWNVGADGTSSNVKVRGCISLDGYTYADGSNVRLDLSGDGDVIVFPGACDNPRNVRRVINGRTVIIPSCN